MTLPSTHDARTTRRRHRIAVIGAGGLGHSAVALLADAGMDLVVFDDDRVETSNLHRLPFAIDEDVGLPKTGVLARILSGRSSRMIVRAERFRPEIALDALAGIDVLIEGADNYASKFLACDAAARAGLSVVHGAALGWRGTVMVTDLARRNEATGCYRCLFEEPPEGEGANCASAGIFGPVATLVGAQMALAALRICAGDRTQVGSIWSYDAWRGTSRTMYVPRREDCPLCGPQSANERRNVLFVERVRE